MDLQYKTFDFKVDDTKPDGSFSGHLAVFNNVDDGGDKILPGAFDKTLAERGSRPLPILWMHDRLDPLGVFTNLQPDSKGLFVEGQLNMDVQSAREKHALAKQGAIDGMSIGYRVEDGGAHMEGKVRALTELYLGEGSLTVTGMAMNDEARIASVKTRWKDHQFKTIRELEECLRDVGLPRAAAKAVASNGFDGLRQCQRDAGLEVGESEDIAKAAKVADAILASIRS